MIWIDAQVGKKNLFTSGTVAVRVGFDRYEHRVNLCKAFGVVELHYPALVRGVVFVENAQVERVIFVGPTPSPGLKGVGSLQSRRLIQVVCVKDQGFPLGVE